MSSVEAPKLNPRQRKQLKYWQDLNDQRGFGSYDLTIIVDDLDPEIKENSVVVCAADIINSLIAVASNPWYENVVLAAVV